ncbi:MAG: carboxypeptidase regulatory-like domain-containing protein [Bryobacteraceae bacterium]
MTTRARSFAIFLISACLLGTSVPGAFAQNAAQNSNQNATGIIRGIVVNEDGVPVVEAEVRPSPVGGASKRWVWTDKDGRFEMDHLPWGDYIVRASKESEAYPTQDFKIYYNRTDVHAVLTAAVPIEEVRVVLGPKAGTLKLVVTDAVSGQPVTAAVRMWDWTDPGDVLSGYGDPLLVPSDRQVGLEVNANGYQTWHYAPYPDSDQAGPLTMKPGQVKTLNIKLRPVPKQ